MKNLGILSFYKTLTQGCSISHMCVNIYHKIKNITHNYDHDHDLDCHLFHLTDIQWSTNHDGWSTSSWCKHCWYSWWSSTHLTLSLHDPVNVTVNNIGSCDLTGASLNMKIISSMSDGPSDQSLLTDWPISLTCLVGGAKSNTLHLQWVRFICSHLLCQWKIQIHSS